MIVTFTDTFSYLRINLAKAPRVFMFRHGRRNCPTWYIQKKNGGRRGSGVFVFKIYVCLCSVGSATLCEPIYMQFTLTSHTDRAGLALDHHDLNSVFPRFNHALECSY